MIMNDQYLADKNECNLSSLMLDSNRFFFNLKQKKILQDLAQRIKMIYLFGLQLSRLPLIALLPCLVLSQLG